MCLTTYTDSESKDLGPRTFGTCRAPYQSISGHPGPKIYEDAGESAAKTLIPLSSTESKEDSIMPSYQQITSAREKAKRIRECAHSFRLERLRMQGSTKDIVGHIAHLCEIHQRRGARWDSLLASRVAQHQL
jgi:hypothetical protein